MPTKIKSCHMSAPPCKTKHQHNKKKQNKKLLILIEPLRPITGNIEKRGNSQTISWGL